MSSLCGNADNEVQTDNDHTDETGRPGQNHLPFSVLSFFSENHFLVLPTIKEMCSGPIGSMRHIKSLSFIVRTKFLYYKLGLQCL